MVALGLSYMASRLLGGVSRSRQGNAPEGGFGGSRGSARGVRQQPGPSRALYGPPGASAVDGGRHVPIGRHDVRTGLRRLSTGMERGVRADR